MSLLDIYNARKKSKEEGKSQGKASAGSLLEIYKQRTGQQGVVAPVKENKPWHQSGVFEDGWQFGDVTKFILGVDDKKTRSRFNGIIGDEDDAENILSTMTSTEIEEKANSATGDERRYYIDLANQKQVSEIEEKLSKVKLENGNTLLEEAHAVASMEDGEEKKTRKKALEEQMFKANVNPDMWYSMLTGDKNITWTTAKKFANAAFNKGVNSFNTSLTSTLDATLGALLKAVGWENNPISKIDDFYDNLYANYSYDLELAKARMGAGGWADGLGNLTESTVAALPQAILAYASMGSSTGASLSATAAQSGGSVLQSAGVTAQKMLKKPQYWMSFATTYGKDYEEAKANGADDLTAGFSATITSMVNAGIEQGGGFEVLPDRLAGKGNKAITEWVKSSLEEGGEEVVQGVVTNAVARLYDSDRQIVDPENMVKEFGMGTAVGAFLSGGQVAVSSGVNAGASAVEKYQAKQLTANEQKVVNKVYEEALAKEEANGKLSAREKTKLYDSIVKEMEQGRISTDTIESVLGGDTYKGYQSKLEQESKLQKEIEELEGLPDNAITVKQRERLAEARKQLEELDVKGAKSSLFDQVDKMTAKDTKLRESYNERVRRGQAFEADLTKYDAKQQETVKKAIESGILNNSNRTHEFVDLIAKISADKGVPFDFANNAKLKESGFAIDGKQVNGFVTADGVTVNVNSAKALNSVVGHEITHVLEGTELYNELQSAIVEYAKSKGDYQGRYDTLAELYKGIEGANIDAELTADLVGDYLFTDADFIKRLSTEHRNVFQKLYDEIKYLCKVVTAGSKEAKELEKVKKLFEEAYRTETKNPTADGGVKYAITEGMTDAERYAELKDKIIEVAKVQENAILDSYDLEGKSLNDIFKFVRENKESLGLNKVYQKDEIQLEFGYSNRGIKKSIRQTADSKVDEREYLDILSCLDQIIDTSVLIERHSDKSGKPNTRLKQVYVLLGAIQKNGVTIPVQLEIKESIDKDNQLYLAVAIKKSGVNVTAATEVASVTIPDFSTISIHELIEKINPDAKDFLKYIPDEFLTPEQMEGKKDGIRRDIEKYPNSPFRHMNLGTDGSINGKMSLSGEGQAVAPAGGYRITGEDIALAPTREGIARMERERIATAQNAPRNDVEELGAPTREDIARMERESVTDNDSVSSKPHISLEDYANNESPVWRNVPYEDEVTKKSIMQDVHNAMVAEGAVVRVSDAVDEAVNQAYPDLRDMKKKERVPILKNAMNKLKNDIRQFLNGFKNQNFEFEVNGKVLDARLYNTGINEVLEKVTQEKAKMLYSTEEIFRNARYLYSTPDYDGDPNVYRWNYFYTPVQIGDETVGVRIAVRDLAKQGESQIYNWGIKKDASLDGVRDDSKNRKPYGVSSDTSINIISEDVPGVKYSVGEPVAEELGAPTREDIARAAEEKELHGPWRMTDPLDQKVEKLFRMMLREEVSEQDYMAQLVKADRQYQQRGGRVEEALERVREAYSKEATATPEIEKKVERLTRKVLHEGIMGRMKDALAEKGFDLDTILKEAENLSTFATVDNTPQRVNEKTFGYKAGQVINDLTVNKAALNESDGIKWLNGQVEKIKKLSERYGIKPGSKESRAAQIYGEGFWVNEVGEYIQYGDAELAIDFPDAEKQAKIKALAKSQEVRQMYDETLDAINEARVRNGYPPIPRRDNYFLHYRAQDDTFSKIGVPFNPNDVRAKDLPTDLNGVTADLKPGKPFFASEMKRTGDKTTYDLLGGLERYMNSAKNQIYHIDDIQTLRAMRNYIADMFGQANGLSDLDSLSPEEQEQRIKEVFDNHLSTYAKFLNEEANIFAGKTALIDRGVEGVLGRRAIQFLHTLNGQVGKNMVGWNVSSAGTNLLPVVQATAKLPKVDMVKAFAQTVSNKFRNDGFVESNPALIRRKGADQFAKTPWQRISDLGYALMSAVDNLSSELIVRAKYNELTRKGMDSQQAHIRAGEWAMRLMGDRSLGQMPQLYNSKTLGLITKFQLEVRNQVDVMVYDVIQEAKAEEGTGNAKKAAKVASTMAQLAIFQHLFGQAYEAVAGYNPAFDIVENLIKLFGFDDDEESEDTFGDNVEQAFLGLLEDLPYTSTFTGGRIPIASALPVKEVITGKDSYGNETSRIETLAGALPYYILPGGYGQAKKTVQGLKMFDDDFPVAGSYTDSGNLRFPVEDTLGNRVQAAVFGQYASENAREYFDNGWAPLKEKQIEEFAALGIPVEDYREIRKQLGKLENMADKFDYIDSLDLTVEQKNILVNNVANRKEPVDMTDYGMYEDFDEFDFYIKNQEKYQFLKDNGIAYKTYNASEESREAYNWAYQNPEKYQVSLAVTEDTVAYKGYAKDLSAIKADKDSKGNAVSGSRKKKVVQYLNGLDATYGAKIILYKMEYPSDDTYNGKIIEYVNSIEGFSYKQKETVLKELGFTVSKDGKVSWN